MGVVDDFEKSDDMGWDVSKGYHWVQMLEELPTHTDVVLVATGDKMMLYNRNYVNVKVVKEKDNGSPLE